MSAIWEQQENEPDAAYTRFLFYRNLGPLRSLEDAYDQYVRTGQVEENEGQAEIGLSEAPKRPKKPHVPGNWKEDCRNWKWEFRANQFDIHVLSQAGRSVIDSFYKTLGLHATQLLETMMSGDLKPLTYREHLEGMMLLGSFISPEAVAAWRAFSSSDSAQPDTTTDPS